MKLVFKWFFRVVLLLVILIILAGVYLYTHITEDSLVTGHYTVSAPVVESTRIVHLSDLHNSVFGENNTELIEAVRTEAPDVIVFTGDMLIAEDEDISVVTSLIAELVWIVPVYYGYGNNEWDWEKLHGKELIDSFTDAGAIVLDTSYLDTEIKGTPVRIGGYEGYYKYLGMNDISILKISENQTFYEAFEQTDRYKILLNHIPVPWVDWGRYNDFAVDLVFTGHYHGGQWVLPIIGPVFAPYIGFNPPYVKGVFSGETATVVMSAGLGNEHVMIPRVNNPPEIVVVDLIPEK